MVQLHIRCAGAVPNVAYSADLALGTSTVVADGGHSVAVLGSIFAKSTGDEPGTLGGVISGTYTREASWLTFSADVRIEGRAACRLTDKMLHNHGNTFNAAGEMQKPLPGADLSCAERRRIVGNLVDQILSHGMNQQMPWDVVERNKCITAAYAQLALARPNLEWATAAAFVSHEAGCAMALAALNFGTPPLHWGPVPVPFTGSDPNGLAGVSGALIDGLAKGNRAIFANVSRRCSSTPSSACPASRSAATSRSPGGNPVNDDILDALYFYDNPTGAAGEAVGPYQPNPTHDLVVHEQRDVLAHAFDDDWFRREISLMQAVRVEPDVHLSSDCDQKNKVPFRGDLDDVSTRVSMGDR